MFVAASVIGVLAVLSYLLSRYYLDNIAKDIGHVEGYFFYSITSAGLFFGSVVLFIIGLFCQ